MMTLRFTRPVSVGDIARQLGCKPSAIIEKHPQLTNKNNLVHPDLVQKICGLEGFAVEVKGANCPACGKPIEPDEEVRYPRFIRKGRMLIAEEPKALQLLAMRFNKVA